MSKPITLPIGAKITFLGIDTTITDLFDSKIKIVVYADSVGCASCSINKTHQWKPFVEFAKPFDGKLKYYFIYAPAKKDIKTIRYNLKNSKLEYPIIVDDNYEFEQLNPHLPKNPAMHTFLLDEDNNVILVGNPLQNKEIEKMFYEEVEKRLK